MRGALMMVLPARLPGFAQTAPGMLAQCSTVQPAKQRKRWGMTRFSHTRFPRKAAQASRLLDFVWTKQMQAVAPLSGTTGPDAPSDPLAMI